ncbi:DnaJ domain-containing protein [Thermodesulfobacteriota bacterium]
MAFEKKTIKPKISSKIVPRASSKKHKRCLACGTEQMGRGRRYCSKECGIHINWVLSLSKGLLKTFNARYAAFSFTADLVILDVLPAWSKGISRFVYVRSSAKKPAEDLKNLILESGREWYQLQDNNLSRSYATLNILEKNHREDIDPESLKPGGIASLRLSKHESKFLKILELDRKDMCKDGQDVKINTAYKKLAKLHHPDMGGDTEKFKKLNEAHKQMLEWSENPQYTSRKALKDCWSYDGFTNRWSPPL